MGKVSSNFVVLLVSIIVTTVVIEVAVRIWIPHPAYGFPRYMFRIHSSRDYELTPNFRGTFRTDEFNTLIITNEHGLRDKDYPKKRVGVYRILVIGDSFTMGHGCDIEDTFPKLLEGQLNQWLDESPSAFEVINAGVGGYSPDMEFDLLKEKMEIYEPDLVVMGFFVGNDFSSALGKRTVWNGYLVNKNSRLSYEEQILGASEFENVFFALRSYLSRYSHFYNLIKDRIQKFNDASSFWGSISKTVKKKIDTVALLSAHKKDTYEILVEDIKNYKNDKLNYTIDAVWVEKIFTEISCYLEDRNIEFLVAVLPNRYQVQPEYYLGNEILYKSKKIEAICNKKNIAVLDLLPAFAEQTLKGGNMYFLFDAHMNPKGHIVTATKLYDKVKKLVQKSSLRTTY